MFDLTHTQRNVLKWLALFLMLLDHLGAIFSAQFPVLLLLRAPGRFAFLAFGFLMAFHLAQRVLDIQYVARYIIKLSVFGLLAQVVYPVLFPGVGFNIFGQFIGLILVILATKVFVRHQYVKAFGCLFIGVSSSYYSDYGLMGLLYCVSCYVFVVCHTRNILRHKILWAIGLSVSALLANINMLSLVWATPIVLLFVFAIIYSVYFILFPPSFNGVPACLNMEGRKPSKWQTYFFYVFYPFHLWLLLGLAVWCEAI